MLKPMDRWAEPPIMEGKKMESLGKIRALHRAELARPGQCTGSLKERHSLHARSDLFEQLQPFRADAVFVQHKTTRAATLPRRREE